MLLIFCGSFALLAGCGGNEQGGNGGGSPEPTSFQTVPVVTTSPETARPELTLPEVPSETVDGLRVQTLFTGLDTPWEVVFAPDGRILITERPGTIRVVEDGRLREEPYAELPVSELGEGGQLGLTLDPDFEENGYLYAYYTTQEGGEARNRLVRLVEKDGTARQDEVLLEAPAASIHDGGRVRIGPDGKLYATIGDTADAGLAQEREALAGKIVRLDLDGSIPEDNPFGDSPVYSYGHRNPQGLAWDGEGNLYAPEHGQSALDELNLVEPGNNYGWPIIEGDEQREGLVPPILHSGSDTWAPSGADYVEGGSWAGSILFTGLRGESLHRVTVDPGDPSRVVDDEEHLKGEYGRLRTVVQGPDGSLYVLTSNRDGRGSPAPEDDRLLRITVPEGQ